MTWVSMLSCGDAGCMSNHRRTRDIGQTPAGDFVWRSEPPSEQQLDQHLPAHPPAGIGKQQLNAGPHCRAASAVAGRVAVPCK